jgi:hypothetical protein
MAKNTTGYFLSTQSWVFFNNVTSPTTPVELLTGVADDTWVYDIVITSTASNALNAQLYLLNGTDQIRLKTLTQSLNNQILIGQGTTTANPLRLMQSSDGNQITVRFLDRDQNYYIPVPNGVKLMFKLDTTPTGAGGSVNIAVFKRDFTG